MKSVSDEVAGFFVRLDEKLTRKEAEQQYKKQQKGRKEILGDVKKLKTVLKNNPKWKAAHKKKEELEADLKRIRARKRKAPGEYARKEYDKQIKVQEQKILAHKEAMEELKVYIRTKYGAPTPRKPRDDAWFGAPPNLTQYDPAKTKRTKLRKRMGLEHVLPSGTVLEEALNTLE